jgi:acetyl esterase/lipase
MPRPRVIRSLARRTTYLGPRVCLALAVFLGVVRPLGAQDVLRDPPIALWPGGAPGALGTEAVDVPTITVYRPVPGTATGAAIVICPGGAYQNLAAHEGDSVAVWLRTLGITSVVLKYRLGPRYHYPAPLLDAARAVRLVRAHAREWGIDPARVGIMGFSAGGHLAATLATHFDDGNPTAPDPVDRLGSRPDIAVLAYPVISMADGITHEGSRRNLLGPSPDPGLIQLLSNEAHVTAATPPTFLFATADDAVVPVANSLRFADALQRAGVPYELHVFQHGPHGVGLAAGFPDLATWPLLLANWLRAHHFAMSVAR